MYYHVQLLYIPMGSIFVNSLSNWEVSIEPMTVGIQGGMIRPAARFSNSMSLCTLKENEKEKEVEEEEVEEQD